jgi:hypothetical protein
VFAPVARKATFAARAAAALSVQPDLRYRDALPLLTAPLRTGGDMAAMLAADAKGAPVSFPSRCDACMLALRLAACASKA